MRNIYDTQNEQSQAFDFVEAEFVIVIGFGFSRDREARRGKERLGRKPRGEFRVATENTISLNALSLTNYLTVLVWGLFHEGCALRARSCRSSF